MSRPALILLSVVLTLIVSACASQQTDEDRVHGSAGVQMFSDNIAAGIHGRMPF